MCGPFKCLNLKEKANEKKCEGFFYVLKLSKTRIRIRINIKSGIRIRIISFCIHHTARNYHVLFKFRNGQYSVFKNEPFLGSVVKRILLMG